MNKNLVPLFKPNRGFKKFRSQYMVCLQVPADFSLTERQMFEQLMEWFKSAIGKSSDNQIESWSDCDSMDVVSKLDPSILEDMTKRNDVEVIFEGPYKDDSMMW